VGDLGAILRAAGLAAFTVGLVLLLVHPPSLSGVPPLAGLLAGSAALVLLAAWVTVALGGRGELGEAEFERLVERSERLARDAGAPGPGDHFDALVAEAIERLPAEFRKLLEDTAVVVSTQGSESRAYGHYFGDGVARHAYEDRIVLYRDTLERDFGHDAELLSEQVERTLRHELAHHLGWGERGVRELGL